MPAEAVKTSKTMTCLARTVVSNQPSHRGNCEACLMCWGEVHAVAPEESAQS